MANVPTRLQESAGGVAYREHQGKVEVVLISVGEENRWQLPKGIVAKNESNEDTAQREVREEAGIETELVDLIDKIEYWYFSKGSKGAIRFHKFVYLYLLKTTGGDVSQHDHEVNEARWVEIHQAHEMLTFDNEKKAIRKAQVMLGLADDTPLVEDKG